MENGGVLFSIFFVLAVVVHTVFDFLPEPLTLPDTPANVTNSQQRDPWPSSTGLRKQLT
jgi:hypothetical protein